MSPSMNVFNNQISDFSSFMIKQQFDNLFVSIKASVQNQSHSKIVFDIQFNIFTKKQDDFSDFQTVGLGLGKN